MDAQKVEEITRRLPRLRFPDIGEPVMPVAFDKFDEELLNIASAFEYWASDRKSETEFSGGFLYSDIDKDRMDLHGFVFVIRTHGKVMYSRALIFLPLSVSTLGNEIGKVLRKRFPDGVSRDELPDVASIAERVAKIVDTGIGVLTKSGAVEKFFWNVFNYAPPGKSFREMLPIEAMTT